MKTRLLIGCAATALLSSCSTISHTAHTAGVDTKVYSVTVADMDVSPQKAAKTIEWKWTPLSTVSIETQKENAEAELLKEADADVVVEPQFTIHRRGLFRGGSVTVTGYPAKYSNFRTMTKEDAEKIALLDGKIAVAYPLIGTSAIKTDKKNKKAVSDNVIDRSKHKFLNLTGGLLLSTENQLNTGGEIGLMYGSYGRSWGWYIKGVWMHCSANTDNWFFDHKHHMDYIYIKHESLNGGALTIGAIKTISSNWNAFLGVGFGSNFAIKTTVFSSVTNNDLDIYPALATEVGFQWNAHGFNIVAGVNVLTKFADYSHSYPMTLQKTGCNIDPFIGVGFSF